MTSPIGGNRVYGRRRAHGTASYGPGSRTRTRTNSDPSSDSAGRSVSRDADANGFRGDARGEVTSRGNTALLALIGLRDVAKREVTFRLRQHSDAERGSASDALTSSRGTRLGARLSSHF